MKVGTAGHSRSSAESTVPEARRSPMRMHWVVLAVLLLGTLMAPSARAHIITIDSISGGMAERRAEYSGAGPGVQQRGRPRDGSMGHRRQQERV